MLAARDTIAGHGPATNLHGYMSPASRARFGRYSSLRTASFVRNGLAKALGALESDGR